MKVVRLSAPRRNTGGGNIIKFPSRNPVSNAEYWRGSPIGMVPAPVLASVWAARRIASEKAGAEAFANTISRCNATITAAKGVV